MMRQMISPEQQVASAELALARLQTSKCFRGQEDLVRDAEEQLMTLVRCNTKGELEPILLSDTPAWPQLVFGIGVLAGIARVLLK
jgi:hypothetical protein